MPRYEDGCLEERDKALTSSETLLTMSLALDRLSDSSSGIDCKDVGEMWASTEGEVTGEARC